MDEALLPYISQSPYYDRWRESQAPEEVVVTDEELPWDAAHPAGPLEGQPIYPEIWQPETGEGYPQGLMPQQGYDVPMQAVPVMAPDVLPTEYPPVEGQFAYTGAPSALGGIELEEGYGRDAYMPTSEEWDAAHAPPPHVPVIPEMTAYKAPRFPVGRADLSIPYYADRLWKGVKDFNEKYIGFNPNIGGRMPSDVGWDDRTGFGRFFLGHEGRSVEDDGGKTVWDLGLVLSSMLPVVGTARAAIPAATKGLGPWSRALPLNRQGLATEGSYNMLMKLVKGAPAVIKFKINEIIKGINAKKKTIDEIRKVDHPRLWKLLESIPGSAQKLRSVRNKAGAATRAEKAAAAGAGAAIIHSVDSALEPVP
jgi:hypothetical protein